jgi:P-type Cu2+ transporter
MKTENIYVSGLFGGLDHLEIEKRLRRLAGVTHAVMNPASESASVTYDDSVITFDTVKGSIEECGFHCGGKAFPRHLCEPGAPLPAAGHHHHASHADVPEHGAVPKTDKKSVAGKARVVPHDAHADMGHGSDMQGVVRDLRTRFLIALVFSIPVFLYSQMGEMLGGLQPPFGVDRNIFLFVLASGAIIYPGWPFYVGAVRALRNGILNMAVLVLLSVGTGYLFSVGATFFFEGEQFFEAASVLLVFILLGHWLEMRARAGASEAIRRLMDLAPPMANVVRDG